VGAWVVGTGTGVRGGGVRILRMKCRRVCVSEISPLNYPDPPAQPPQAQLPQQASKPSRAKDSRSGRPNNKAGPGKGECRGTALRR